MLQNFSIIPNKKGSATEQLKLLRFVSKLLSVLCWSSSFFHLCFTFMFFQFVLTSFPLFLIPVKFSAMFHKLWFWTFKRFWPFWWKFFQLSWSFRKQTCLLKQKNQKPQAFSDNLSCWYFESNFPCWIFELLSARCSNLNFPSRSDNNSLKSFKSFENYVKTFKNMQFLAFWILLDRFSSRKVFKNAKVSIID